MIVRIRTNIGNWRVKVTGDEITLKELRQETANQHSASLTAVKLCLENGTDLVCDSLTLRQLGIANGTMLLIKDTLVEHVIDKAYIEDGVIVKAGVRISTCDSTEHPSEHPDYKNDKRGDKNGNSADDNHDESNPYSAQVADAKPTHRLDNVQYFYGHLTKK